MNDERKELKLWQVDLERSQSSTFFIEAETRAEAQAHANELVPLPSDFYDAIFDDETASVYHTAADPGPDDNGYPVWRGGADGHWESLPLSQRNA